MMRRLHELHIKEFANVFCSRIRAGTARDLRHLGDGSRRTFRGREWPRRDANKTHRWLEFDSLVLVTGRHSNDSVYRELKGQQGQVVRERRPGCVSYRRCGSSALIADAIFSGHRLAREIEEANAQFPSPTNAK